MDFEHAAREVQVASLQLHGKKQKNYLNSELEVGRFRNSHALCVDTKVTVIASKFNVT